VELYTAPPTGSTVVCADELGPVIPRTFPPAPGWSPDGHLSAYDLVCRSAYDLACRYCGVLAC